MTDPGEGYHDGDSLGTLLKRCRTDSGQDLETVARDLCIRRRYIEAIEADRYADLPGPTYATGFIRAYAEHLGLDPDPAVARFHAESRSGRTGDELKFPSPLSEGGTPKAAFMLVGLAVAGIAYGVWYLGVAADREVVSLTTPVPERLAALVTEDAPSPVVELQAPAAAPGSAPASAPSSGAAETRTAAGPAGSSDGIEAEREDASAATPVSVSAPIGLSPPAIEPPGAEPPGAEPPGAEPAGAEPAETEAAALRAAVPDAEGDARIVLAAVADCWIEIKDTEAGRVVYARLMRPGDTYSVPDRPNLALLVGSAGALDVFVDGEPIPRLGRPGAVIRSVSLDADALRARATGGAPAADIAGAGADADADADETTNGDDGGSAGL